MDEAERCHRARLHRLRQAARARHGATRSSQQSGLYTWAVTGDGPRAARRTSCAARPGVEQVVAFGTALHVSGTDAARARASARAVPRAARPRVAQIEPGLEDVFIQPDGARRRTTSRMSAPRLSLAALLAPMVVEGVHPDAPRPRSPSRMMVGIPLHAARPVRLRHQHRPEAPADRGARRRPRASFARSFVRAMREQRLFPHRTEVDDARPRPSRAARARRGPVRRHHPGGLLARARCAASGRCCWSRPTPPTRPRPATRWPRSLNLDQTALAPRSRGRRSPTSSNGAAAVRAARPAALQPGGHHPVQHRARPDGRRAHHDHGHDHRAGDHPRARARHDGEPARHAGAAGRGDDRQDRPLHPRRLRPGRR